MSHSLFYEKLYRYCSLSSLLAKHNLATCIRFTEPHVCVMWGHGAIYFYFFLGGLVSYKDQSQRCQHFIQWLFSSYTSAFSLMLDMEVVKYRVLTPDGRYRQLTRLSEGAIDHMNTNVTLQASVGRLSCGILIYLSSAQFDFPSFLKIILPVFIYTQRTLY